MVGAMYSIPASIFRAYGGHLSDKYGARTVMYWTFLVAVVCTFILAYPPTQYVVEGIRGPIAFSTRMGLLGFMAVAFVLGFFMSLGKAAVYKHIPVYYPDRVGAVGGVVGLVGGLGGFVLPIAFGALNDLTGVWQSCFWLLFVIAAISLIWMHLAVRQMEKAAAVAGVPVQNLPELPEMQPIHGAAQAGALAATGAIQDWRPLPGAICGSRCPACSCPSRSGWSGRSSSPSCRASASPSPTSSSSGSPRCQGYRARRCGSSTASCPRSSGAGSGRRSRPGRY